MNAENVIIHRFVKVLEKEAYVVDVPEQKDMYIPVTIEGIIHNIYISYDKSKAKVFSQKEGIVLRDFLNQEREGHQYLWLLQEV